MAEASTTVPSIMDHLVLELPKDLDIYDETFEGPIEKSSQNLQAMSKDLIWIHIVKEEYEALLSSIEYHPEDA